MSALFYKKWLHLLFLLLFLINNRIVAQNEEDAYWKPYILKLSEHEDIQYVAQFLNKLPNTKYVGQSLMNNLGENLYGVCLTRDMDFALARKIRATFPNSKLNVSTYAEMKRLFPKEITPILYSLENHPKGNNPAAKNAKKKPAGDSDALQPMITGPEQDCPNALPVCQLTFSQPNSYTGQGTIDDEIQGRPLTCLGSGELNGVWYIFTVSATGTLNFSITPTNLGEDYDWAVYDLTNNVCTDIVTGVAPEVSCNFSGSPGVTGANGLGGTQNNPTFNVNFGDTYVLYISNFSSTQNGYSLDFTQSTASIVDNTPPVFIGVQTPIACGATTLNIQFSENVTCSTISNFDFTLTDPGGNPVAVTGITGANCLGPNSYEDVYTITVTPPITQSGTYVFDLVGTVTDICGQTAASVTTPFTINLGPPATIATSSPVACGGTLSVTAGNMPVGAPFTITRSDNGFTVNGVGPGGTFSDPTPVNGLTYTVTYTQGGCQGNPATSAAIPMSRRVTLRPGSMQMATNNATATAKNPPRIRTMLSSLGDHPLGQP